MHRAGLVGTHVPLEKTASLAMAGPEGVQSKIDHLVVDCVNGVTAAATGNAWQPSQCHVGCRELLQTDGRTCGVTDRAFTNLANHACRDHTARFHQECAGACAASPGSNT